MSWTPPLITASISAPLTGLTGSYLSAADADAYFLTSFSNAEWAALTPAEKDVALIQATSWLEQLCWKGEKCSDAQPLQWPRTIPSTGCCAEVTCSALPAALLQATSELALAMHKNQTAIIGGGGSGQQIKSASLGSMSVTYADGATSTKVSGSAPLVLQKFPWLVDLLGPCLMRTSAGGARVLHRECVTTYNGRYY